jgi:hypothetical protein
MAATPNPTKGRGTAIMKTKALFAISALAMALAAPVSAHHNSPWGTDLEIGDMQGNHEAAIDSLELPTNRMSDMDPADSLMPDGIEPQPNGVSIPDTTPDDALGPVNTPNIP